MLLLRGVHHERESVHNIKQPHRLLETKNTSPSIIEAQVGYADETIVLFDGHGPALSDPASGLALYYNNSGRMVYMRPSDIHADKWQNKIFLSTA